jgi:hypothetical protein
LIEKYLTDEEKKLYVKEVKKDITFFRKSYQRRNTSTLTSRVSTPRAAQR